MLSETRQTEKDRHVLQVGPERLDEQTAQRQTHGHRGQAGGGQSGGALGRWVKGEGIGKHTVAGTEQPQGRDAPHSDGVVIVACADRWEYPGDRKLTQNQCRL